MFSQEARKWNLVMVGLFVFLYITVYAFYRVYLSISISSYEYIHLFLHILVVSFSVAISVLMWHVARMRKQRLFVLMGSFFVLMSMLQMVLLLLSDEIVFNEIYNYSGLAIFLNTLTIILLPAGGILVSIWDDKMVNLRYRNVAYAASFIVSLALILGCYIIFLKEWYLLDAQQTELWINITTTSAFFLYLILALRVMPRYYERLTIQFQYTWSFISFMTMLAMFQLSTEKMDFYYLYAQVVEVLAYMLLSSAVFSLTIESPYRRLAKSRETIRKIAYYHEVTNLPNRIYFRSLVNKTLLMNNCDYASMIVLEVQRMAPVRSVLGIDSTHNILRCVTDRLQDVLPEDALLGMLKEDKIGVMLPCDLDVNHEKIYYQLANAIKEPMEVHHYVLQLHTKMGIAQYPEHGRDAETLIKHANLALMETTRADGAYVVYTDMLEFDGRYQLQLEHDLQYAIERNELFIEYQPQLDLSTNEIFAAEALIRWRHRTEGIISPVRFIPIAERTGLILKIGEWVLEQACEDANYWSTLVNRPVKIAVNVSVSQLLQSNVVTIVKRVIEKSGLNPSYLELEITESMTIDIAGIIPILQELKEIGVSIAVDDFGTGYSSLSYLSDLPLDYLKVDRSFVEKLSQSKRDDDLMRAILTMGQTIHLQTIVEGVETHEQFQQLKRMPCDYIQGYFVSKPVRFHELLKLSSFDSENYV